MLDAVFGAVEPAVTPLQMCARATVILVYGVAAIRLVGRRIFGRWAAIDVVMSVLIGSNLSRALTGNAPLVETLIGTTFLLALYWAMAMAAFRWDWVSRLVKGRAVMLVENGEIDWTAMRRQGLGERDLEEALSGSGHTDLERVSRVRLERNGDINVIAR